MLGVDLGDIEKTLADLLGCPVSVGIGGMPATNDGVTATYVDGGGSVRSAVWFDRRLAAYLGASLAMVPRAEADEAATGALPENLMENVSEVLNVLAGALGQGTRMKLSEVTQTPPPAAPISAILAGSRRSWLKVDVSGYGPGVAVLLHAA